MAKQTTTTTTSLPEKFEPHFVELFNRSMLASEQVSGEPFGGPLLAPQSPLQQEALGMQEQTARDLMGIGQPIMDLGQQTLSGQFLYPESNPFLQANIEAATRPITDLFLQQSLPQLQSQAIQSGAFGGNREGIAATNLATGVNRNILDVSAELTAENYARERQLQLMSPQLIEAGARFQQLGPELLGQVGDVQRQLGQQEIDAQLAAFNQAQQAPFAPLFPLASVLFGGDVGSAGHQVTTGIQNVSGPSAFASGITGALGGGALGAGVGNIFWDEGDPGFIPGLPGDAQAQATGAGAILGGLAGIFS